MKKTAYALMLAGTLLFGSDFDIGVSGSDGKIDGFTLSIGDYYRVPHRDVVLIERSVPRDEMSVVYLLSHRAHRDAQFIANLRMRGMSWWDITLRLGLDPYTLYVVESRHHRGPPFGKAYGYHKEGKKHRLRDDEIVELANIRFLSKYHRINVDDVIERRRSGENYYRIDDHYREKRVGRIHVIGDERREGKRDKHDRERQKERHEHERGRDR